MPYIGTDSVKTTTQLNTELISTPIAWINVKMHWKQVSLINENDCTIIVNNGNPIFLRAFQGWNVDTNKNNNLEPIWSLVIVETGIKYNYAAGY